MKTGKRAARISATGMIVVSMLVLAGGCAQRQPIKTWQPKPLVQWENLINGPIVPARDEYRVMPGKPSRGLFPASLAVTRVAIEKTGDSLNPLRPRLTSNPRNEFLQWNSALDDQMAVGEVFPIAENDLGGGEAVPDQIVDAFHALRARLGLVYAVNELSETETEMFGVLYDAESKRAVASIHAQAKSIVPPEVAEKNPQNINLWETDSRALVRAEFQTLLHGCIHELIRRDGPASVVAPVGWVPAHPVRPVEWPPRRTRANP